MAIELYTGVPGSGKTYLIVKRLLSEFIGYTVITNIDGLKLPHLSLDSMIEKAGGKEVFFTREYQGTLPFTQLIYIIDEAQFYFGKKYYNEAVFNYFQYHRHFPGHHVILATQNAQTIPSQLVVLCDYECYVLTRKASLFGEFKFKTVTPAGGSSRDCPVSRVARHKDVFKWYKSTSMISSVKQGKLHSTLWLIVICCVLGFPVISYFLFFRGAIDKASQSFGNKKSSVASKAAPPPADSLAAPGFQSQNSSPAHAGIDEKKPLVPIPTAYNPASNDLFFVLDGSPVRASVSAFTALYPPAAYQYGFVYSPNKFFRIFDVSGTEQFFPIKSDIFLSSGSRLGSRGNNEIKSTPYELAPVIPETRHFSPDPFLEERKNLLAKKYQEPPTGESVSGSTGAAEKGSSQ